jgi:hypothetical protein
MYFSDGYRIISGPICLVHTEDVRQYNYVARLGYITSGHIGSTSTTSCALTTCLTAASALHQQRRTPQLLVSRPHHLYITFAVHRVYSSPGRTGSTSTSPCAASTCLPAAAALPQLRRASGCLGLSRGSSSTTRLRRASGCLSTSRGSSSTTSLTPRVRVPRHVGRLVARLLVDYSAYTARPGASARRAARRRLLRLRRASGCLGTSRGSSSTTSPTSRVRVLRHVARLIVNYFAYIARPGALACRAARLVYYFAYTARPGASHVARLVVDYFSTPPVLVPQHVTRHVAQLFVDYFAYTARPGASARRRLLRLRHASGCLDTSRGSSRGSSLRRASGCPGTSCGSSTTSPRASSSSATSPMMCDRVPRLLLRRPRVVSRLDFMLIGCTGSCRVPGHSASRLNYSSPGCTGSTVPTQCTWTRHVAARVLIGRLHWLPPCARSLCLVTRLLHARPPRLRLAATVALLQPRCASRLLVSRQHQLYFEYVVRRCNIVFWSHHVDHSSRLVFQTSRERQSRPNN